MFFQKLLNFFLDLIFPPICLSCKSHLSSKEKDFFVCGKCENQNEINNGFFCPKCLKRLPEPKKVCHPKTKFILAAAGNYKNSVVRELIHILKYQKIKTALKPIEKIIEAYISRLIGHESLLASDFLIIPIPLHPKKERERGFNQALFISEIIFKTFSNALSPGTISKTKIEKDNLIKTRTTSPQIDLDDFEKRSKNVENCFALTKPKNISKKNIILVDDVYTSGATMEEAVKVLKSAGARKIIGFVLAKA